ncbi:succinylglutamate desuccinylase/aspartoacylase domain-containing protein [Allohahella marinimesophila]|uniref:Succinylglutamate desuccinylase/Aspartoacylase catalytic domain-containing protein n=1 Tax=Allohahella marinimesophila TaxID=1054972 RepID=A0ABP7NLA4_9GAMM
MKTPSPLPELSLADVRSLVKAASRQSARVEAETGNGVDASLQRERALAAAFLNLLPGPCLLHLNADPSKVQARDDRPSRRLVITLLHGNEPSGLLALLRLVQAELEPHGIVACIVANPSAALHGQAFRHRFIPGHSDLNRCFFNRPEPSGMAGPEEDVDAALASSILACIRDFQPESLIDIHNTSGKGPAFAVSIRDDACHRALTALWTCDMIVTDLRLGALMELSERSVPTVTIECGGAGDSNAVLIAYEGLRRFCQLPGQRALEPEAGAEQAMQTRVFRNPMRLQLDASTSIAYADAAAYHQNEEVALELGKDIVLADDADALNFGAVGPDTVIARMQPEAFAKLSVKSHIGVANVTDYFELRRYDLVTKHSTRFFMMTTRADIALSDCLCYFIANE